ncbi:uncharacterized protein [Argopecten irradians]|uniref:uncharacterized protein n=1 Tax=Argopecten irradians TaxID=31199 RepID=UPI0037100F3F
MATPEENLPIVGVNDLAKPIAEGYLEKKRKEKKFRSEKLQKRWCVIHNNNFYYFIKPNDPKQKGGFSLKGYSFHKLGDLSFSIACEGRRHYEFVAPSKEEVGKWGRAITKISAALKKTLKKSESFAGSEADPPVSPSRDRSISIPTDGKPGRMPPQMKPRSHTHDPFESRFSKMSSRDRAYTLGRTATIESQNTLLKKTNSSPYVNKSTIKQSKPPLPPIKKISIDEFGYAKVPSVEGNPPSAGNLKRSATFKAERQESSSEESETDATNQSRSAPRSRRAQRTPSRKETDETQSFYLTRQKMPIPPPLAIQSSVSSDDEEDYAVPDELVYRPESDYDIAGNYLRKKDNGHKLDSDDEDDYMNASEVGSAPKMNSIQKAKQLAMVKNKMKINPDEEKDQGEDEDDDGYIAASKIASLPNANKKQMAKQLDMTVKKESPQTDQDDIYFEPCSAPFNQEPSSQTNKPLSADNESPYFLPVDETTNSQNDEPSYFEADFGEEEDLYFEPLCDVTDSVGTQLSRMNTIKTYSEKETVENRKYKKLTRTASRNSDGYSKPQEVELLKKKPSPSDTKKSNLTSDDHDTYVNLPCQIPNISHRKQMASEDHSHPKNKMKLPNMKLKDSIDDSNNSDSDEYYGY